MKSSCEEIHKLFWKQERFKFTSCNQNIPANGIYALYEKGELGHFGDRIVRIGTHTAQNRLVKRLDEHFLNENKDRSIFRKNIGRAILNSRKDELLDYWNIDFTSKANREKFFNNEKFHSQQALEREVSQVIRENFSYSVVELSSQSERKIIESKLISTISQCPICKASLNWLGHYSPIQKIKESGLWLVQGLNGEQINTEDLLKLNKSK